MACAFNTLAFAGPPFVTDDPEPVDYQHWEVNYAVSKTWRNNGASANLPSVDINYGYSPDVQLHVQPRYSYEKEGTRNIYGIDNTEVGVKYRFLNKESGDSRLMLGIYPSIQLPTGDNRLGSERGKLQGFLPVWAQYEKNDWTVYGGIGYRVNQSLNSKNSWFFGGAVLYQLTPALQVGGELYRETSTTLGDPGTDGFNLGGIYNLGGDYHLLFSAGRALSNIDSTNRLSVYTALQVIY